MPKNLNYPLASFQKAYELAEAVDALGGSCSVENCAQKMQRKISGGFMVIISSAQKFTLINSDKSLITISEEYKLIKHSYTNTERIGLLRKAFLSPQVFSILYERFKGKILPAEMLDKILIREFSVEEKTAARVAGYFTDGLKTYGLLNANNLVAGLEPSEIEPEKEIITPKDACILKEVVEEVKPEEKKADLPDASFTGKKTASYEMQLAGPGLTTKISVEDEDDLQIVEAMLRKIRKSLLNNSQ